MVATEPDRIRSAIAKQREWIESVLSVTIDQIIVLRASNNFTSLAARRVMADVPLAALKEGPTPSLRAEVQAVEYPKGVPPLMNARTVPKRGVAFGDRQSVWEIGWGDTPVAIRFKSLRGAVIVMDLPYHDHDTTCWNEIVICRQDEVAAVMELMKESNVHQDGALFSTGRSFRSVKSSNWDDLVLDTSVIQLVKNDYESFFAREEWFRSLRLPFRRGYLLQGSPGNGKTSVVRAMLSRPGMRGFPCSPSLETFVDRTQSITVLF